MKNLMRIISVLLLISGVLITGVAIATEIARINVPPDFSVFITQLLIVCTASIMPIVSIAICAFCLERNDENYLTRIIPIYMIIPIIIMSLLVFFNFGTDISSFLVKVYSFFESTFLCVTLLSVLLLIKPNNQITKVLKLIAYGIIALNVIMAIAIQVKSYMVDTLPNVYDYDRYGGFNFSTVARTESIANGIYAVSILAEAFTIALLFTTNYAFSSKIELDVDDIDYNAVKSEADDIYRLQMEKRYNKNGPIQEPNEQIQTNGNNNNLMNINNQLGLNSNVGQVQEKAKEVKIQGEMTDIMPISNGPVKNETVQTPTIKTNNQESAVPRIEEVNTTPVQQPTMPTSQTIQQPVQPTQVQPTQVQPTQVQPIPVQPTQVQPTQVQQTPIQPTTEKLIPSPTQAINKPTQQQTPPVQYPNIPK